MPKSIQKDESDKKGTPKNVQKICRVPLSKRQTQINPVHNKLVQGSQVLKSRFYK